MEKKILFCKFLNVFGRDGEEELLDFIFLRKMNSGIRSMPVRCWRRAEQARFRYGCSLKSAECCFPYKGGIGWRAMPRLKGGMFCKMYRCSSLYLLRNGIYGLPLSIRPAFSCLRSHDITLPVWQSLSTCGLCAQVFQASVLTHADIYVPNK